MDFLYNNDKVYLFIALPKYKWLWIMAFFAANAR